MQFAAGSSAFEIGIHLIRGGADGFSVGTPNAAAAAASKLIALSASRATLEIALAVRFYAEGLKSRGV